MRRRIEIDDLRSSDPATLQVLADDALRRPLGQIAPATLVDLMALAELDDLPKPLQRDLLAFAERIPREISDLPDGGTWNEFLEEYGALPPERVPAGLREAVEAESRRDDREAIGRARAVELVQRWAEIEPEEIVLPTGRKTRPQVLPEVPPPDEERPVPAAPRRTPTPKEPRYISPEEAERRAWIRRTCVERLADYRDNGLAEPVLVAGVIHRAKDVYGELAARDVLDVLKEMKTSGQLRQSAGRWRLVSRW